VNYFFSDVGNKDSSIFEVIRPGIKYFKMLMISFVNIFIKHPTEKH